MKTEVFREIIKQREYVEEISCGEWADGIEECRKQEISILSEDFSPAHGVIMTPSALSPVGVLTEFLAMCTSPVQGTGTDDGHGAVY